MNVVFEAIETGFFLYSYYLSNDEAEEGRLFENWLTVCVGAYPGKGAY